MGNHISNNKTLVVVSEYHNDHLGTPLALTDKDGAVVAEWKRDPFGMVVSKTGSVDDNNMFPGQVWDADAGLAYNWNRWYSPEIGRYVEVDPQLQLGAFEILQDRWRKFGDVSIMEGISKATQKRALKRKEGWSGYIYAAPSPLAAFDPQGLCSSQLIRDVKYRLCDNCFANGVEIDVNDYYYCSNCDGGCATGTLAITFEVIHTIPFAGPLDTDEGWEFSYSCPGQKCDCCSSRR